jgi:transposase
MSAFYAGLDVSDKSTAICVIDNKGETQFEGSAETTPQAIAAALKPYARQLEKIGHEAGAKSPWLQKGLLKKRLPIVCLDPRVTSEFLHAQRNKTDKNDARGIAQILRTGWYTVAHVKSDEAFRAKLILAHRRTILRSAVSIETSLRMSMKLFGARIVKKGRVITVVQSTRRRDPELTRMSNIMLRVRTALLVEVTALNELVAKIAKGDAVCRRLMTMPGVGPITALTFKAAVDDPSRFRSSRSLAASFGLTPRRKQSGEKDISGHISHMGDQNVRTVLFEAAFTMLTVSRSKCPLRQWGLKLAKAKGTKFAAVATARKMAVIMHQMWIHGRDFDPSPAIPPLPGDGSPNH